MNNGRKKRGGVDGRGGKMSPSRRLAFRDKRCLAQKKNIKATTSYLRKVFFHFCDMYL